MYTKARFTRLGSFEEATHGWFWGSYRDIFGALTLGSKAAAASLAGVSVEAHGSFPPRLKVGASSEAPTFSIALPTNVCRVLATHSALFYASGVCYDINCFCSYAGITGAAGGGQFV